MVRKLFASAQSFSISISVRRCAELTIVNVCILRVLLHALHEAPTSSATAALLLIVALVARLVVIALILVVIVVALTLVVVASFHHLLAFLDDVLHVVR